MNDSISSQKLNQFRERGFVSIPDFFKPAELQSIRDWINEISHWPEAVPKQAYHHFERIHDGTRVLARSENFVPFHGGIRNLLTGGKVLEVISELFGEQAVLFKEKINYKLPGGGGFAPHQDATAYKYGKMHITTLIAVDESTEENGCLWFSPGLHKQGFLQQREDGCLGSDFARKLSWQSAPVPAGGAVFFDSFAPHRSEPNHSSRSRRALYVTYNKLSEGDLREDYYKDRQIRIEQFESENPKTQRISTIGHFQGDIVE